MAIAIVNAFSQLGNIAGSYVWNLSDNGYRKSYGIVTAMFGITVVGCFFFRMILIHLNKQLAEGEGVAWDAKPDVKAQTAEVEAAAPEDAAAAQENKVGFRYLV